MAKITKMLVGESLVGDGNEVVGMRAGGRRELIVPPELSYENNKRMVRKPDPAKTRLGTTRFPPDLKIGKFSENSEFK